MNRPLHRCLSSLKDLRVTASTQLSGPADTKYKGGKYEFIEAIRQALYASKIISYAQGFMLMRQAAKEFGWTLNYGGMSIKYVLNTYFTRHIYIRHNSGDLKKTQISIFLYVRNRL